MEDQTLVGQRSAFFLPDDEHYLNCAYLSPTTQNIERAALDALTMMRRPSDITSDMFFETADAVRSAFASLVNVPDPNQVAIIPSVSYGIATVAKNASVHAGQKIVVLHEQFPSNVYSWRRLADDRGARIITVRCPKDVIQNGDVLTQRLIEEIDRDTAVVAVPQVHWTDGARLDLDEISGRCRSVGALLMVDGSQSVGAVPIDVQKLKPDALISAGYKWLFGPYGICLAHYGPRLLDGIPIEENWISREGSREFARLVDYRDSYQPGAIRFDMGERSNFLLLPMMLEGLNHVLRWRPERIQSYCKGLIEPSMSALADFGFRVSPATDRFSHLVGVRLPDGMEPARVAAALRSAKISVSVRGNAIRVSPHVYNDVRDMDALVDVLRTESGRWRSTSS